MNKENNISVETYLEDIDQFQLQLRFYEESIENLETKLMKVRFFIFFSGVISFLLGVIITILIISIEHQLF